MSGTISPAVARLRALATKAAKTGTAGEAPEHPDAELLALCAASLDLNAKAGAIDRIARSTMDANIHNPAFMAEMSKKDSVLNQRRSAMMRLGKIPAKTAAGVYAKALVLKDSNGTAPRLALSLAQDLETCPGLRSSLWPAEREG